MTTTDVWIINLVGTALIMASWIVGDYLRSRRFRGGEIGPKPTPEIGPKSEYRASGKKTREAELARLNAEAEADAERLYGIYKAKDDAEADEARTWVPPVTVDESGVLPMIEYDGKRIAGAHIVSVEVERGGRSPEEGDFIDHDYEEKYDGWLKRAREIDYTQTTILVRTIAGSVTAFWISHHKADALLSALIEARDRCLRIWLQRGHTDPVWRVVSGEKRGTVPGEW